MFDKIEFTEHNICWIFSLIYKQRNRIVFAVVTFAVDSSTRMIRVGTSLQSALDTL